MAFFNRGSYTIYERKEMTGDTPMTPESPRAEMATTKHDVGRTASYAAVGALAAQSVIGALRSEIGDTTGNEVLQNNINNAMLATGYGLLIAKGGVVALAGIAIKGATDEILRQRSIRRSNVAVKLEEKLKGRRVAIGKGSVYYG